MTEQPPLSHYPDLGDRVYYLIREQILTAQMPPGSLLLGAELAREMGVSRTPVADALNVLAAEGLVESVPRKGYFVATVDAQDYQDLMDALRVIELASVERGVARASETQRLALRQQLGRMDECLAGQGGRGSYQEWVRRDAQFHGLLVESSGNPYLSDTYRRLGARAIMARVYLSFSSEPRPSQEAAREHATILAAFEVGDMSTLKAAIAEHRERSAQLYAAISTAAPRPAEEKPASKPASKPESAAKRLHWPGRNRFSEA